MPKAFNPEIVAFVDRLTVSGTNYRLDEWDGLYAEELGFLVLTRDGAVVRFSKAQMLDEYRLRRDAGEPPLSTEMRVLHVEELGDEATAILYRRMSRYANPVLCELRLKKAGGFWGSSARPSSRGPIRREPSASCHRYEARSSVMLATGQRTTEFPSNRIESSNRCARTPCSIPPQAAATSS